MKTKYTIIQEGNTYTVLDKEKVVSKGFKNTIIKLLTSEGFQGFIKKNNKPASMPPKTEEYLKELYYEPTSRLSELLGRNFLKYWGFEN